MHVDTQHTAFIQIFEVLKFVAFVDINRQATKSSNDYSWNPVKLENEIAKMLKFVKFAKYVPLENLNEYSLITTDLYKNTLKTVANTVHNYIFSN